MTDIQQLPLFEQGHLTRDSHLEYAIVPFLTHLQYEGKSQNTLISFRSDMNLLGEFLGKDIALGKISTRRLQEFLEWLEFRRGIPCSRKSYARRVTTLKVFFKWLKEEKVRPDDPAAALVQRSGPAPLQSIVPADEVEKIIRYAGQLRTGEKPDTRPYLLFTLLLETGIKKSETAALTLDSVENRNTARPNIIIRYERQNIFKERRLPIPAPWIEALDEYLEQYSPKGQRIFDCTPRNLEYVLTDLAKAAGAESKVSFETMRWTCAVRDYLAGMNMDDLREKMGLSEISWRETSQKIIKLATRAQIKQMNP